MSFIDFPVPTPVFPTLPLVGFPVKKYPQRNSLVARATDGSEVRATRACFPLWEFELTISGLRERTQNQVPYEQYQSLRELQLISQLFLACRGMYGEFYYLDTTDFSRNAGENTILAACGTVAVPTLEYKIAADGNATVFIPMRNWGPSGAQPTIQVTTWEPVGGIAALSYVAINGVTVPPSQYTFSGNEVIFNSPPAAGATVTAALSFYYRCRFTSDEHQYEEFMNNLWQLGKCRFRSVKP